jgi:2-dehydropantoate 2-reductase
MARSGSSLRRRDMSAIEGGPDSQRACLGGPVLAPGGTAFVTRIIDEVVAVVTAQGHPPRPAFLAEMRKSLTDPASSGISSMYRDLLQGRPIEAEQIVGDMLARRAP